MTENQHWLSSRRWLKILLIVFLPLIAYANSLNNELFLDDLDYIVNNAYIRDWRYFLKFFTENLIAGAGKISDYYRPAIQVAFTFGYSLCELNPIGYHLMSILFHTACAILLYFFLLTLTRNGMVALVTTLLFAVHPVQTEAVDSASALGILMGMFFMLLTLIGHFVVAEFPPLQTGGSAKDLVEDTRQIKEPSKSDDSIGLRIEASELGNYICGVILSRVWVLKGVTYFSLIIALLSKETMVVIPGYIFLIEFFFLCPKGQPATTYWRVASCPSFAQSPSSGEEVLREIFLRFLRCLVRSLPYLIIVAVYVTLRFTVLNFGGTENLYHTSNVFTENWLVRFYTFLSVLVEFMKVIFWPQNLYMERGTALPIYVSFLNLPVILGFMIFVGMLFITLLCTVIFLSSPQPALLPKGEKEWMKGATAKSEESQNKFIQIVPFGILWFFFGLVPVSNVFIPISSIMVESWLYTPVVGILLIFSGLCILLSERTGIFRVSTTFFLILILSACIVRTIQQNRIWKNPITFYEHVLQYVPKSARFRNNLAMAYADKKQYNKSVEQYLFAIQINDQYPETHHNLANSYLEIGRVQDAEKEFFKAIQMNPRFFHSYVALASLYSRYNRLDLARTVLENLIKNEPSRWEGYYNLGLIYLAKGHKETAVSLWKQGLNFDPYNKAIREAIEKVEMNPNN